MIPEKKIPEINFSMPAFGMGTWMLGGKLEPSPDRCEPSDRDSIVRAIDAGTQQKVEPKRMRIWGDWLTLDNLPNQHAEDRDAPPLVPPSWELVRQGNQGVPEVLATSVLAYDLAADGTVAYSNGSGIYLLSPQGELKRVAIAHQIEAVRFLNSREQQE
ncbi:MAG: hypothetical protein J7545_17905 [Roseofilum sp. SBFL]|uniref:hypothetical protein n=1 Tax=unclassified Roseofilum TaxID=2620099 RepID=UPI001B2559C0|nr:MULTISPECIES: hypothetical protein [unclassified Roseofilum]MBP0015855.1 hypothetical protein [Roseofilum sp. SID3]MBP0025415.1 hypothetical protein [Roseofilum sp. SID2]MBP0038669.1 hypothetical protein [Roseofilum sp. SID1]MBP0043823.1 hypothetical protein [Roseofilum sp. SBFL]